MVVAGIEGESTESAYRRLAFSARDVLAQFLVDGLSLRVVTTEPEGLGKEIIVKRKISRHAGYFLRFLQHK
jgi:hypothetical protein